ncbi:GNAT family N-acetyltransferase, partial [Rhizobium leguminosarum]|uniref:GNAT family N-acetyltransferase n=1 Tax=Rhizobium leguminosarum TaxID=384 RepID=UPI003F99BAE2
IAEIYRGAVRNGVASDETVPPSGAELAQRCSAIVSQQYPYIAATDADGTLLGYAYASACRTRPAYRWLVEESIYLAPEARGRGIGKARLAELI